MADAKGDGVSAAIARLKESRPPATDTFTYLTIIDKSLSPGVLPALLEILQDVELTKDIGWDLVEMLIRVPGSEECLGTIARLGNPREVILKVLEVLEKLKDEEDPNGKFITLLGMLGILHKRLEVKSPSRFAQATLHTVHGAYQPNADMTAAVIGLVRSLSGQTRPLLPKRKSSVTVPSPFHSSDDKNAPDPEAESTDKMNASEPAIMSRLMQSFITCIIETYVNANELEWPSRLLEFYNPERIVPGKKTMMQAFKEEESLLTKDGLVGQLVALAGDLGLSKMEPATIKELCAAPLSGDPLSIDFDAEHPDQIKMSTFGFWCLTAYWLFASEVFDGDYDQPDMDMFPDHFDMMRRFLGEEPQSQIAGNPGTAEALLVMGLWLDNHQRVSAKQSGEQDFMAYHHLLTLCSVFHPSIRTRNAATTLAGLVLHADPDDRNRLKILEDLLENCMFASLQACAVTWLREELIISHKRKLDNVFSSPESIEFLQYSLFPNVSYLKDVDIAALSEYWIQNHQFHLQVANFALLLFSGRDFAHLQPEGMSAAVEQRYVEPLLHAAKVLREAAESRGMEGDRLGSEIMMQLSILVDRLQRLSL